MAVYSFGEEAWRFGVDPWRSASMALPAMTSHVRFRATSGARVPEGTSVDSVVFD